MPNRRLPPKRRFRAQFESLGARVEGGPQSGLWGRRSCSPPGARSTFSALNGRTTAATRRFSMRARHWSRLSARLVDAQETERRTISRELHDQVGQTLNALLVDAANLAKRIHRRCRQPPISGQHSDVRRFQRELHPRYRPAATPVHAGRSGPDSGAGVASPRSIPPQRY